MSSDLYFALLIIAVIVWCIFDGMKPKEIGRFFLGGIAFIGLAAAVGLAFRFT